MVDTTYSIEFFSLTTKGLHSDYELKNQPMSSFGRHNLWQINNIFNLPVSLGKCWDSTLIHVQPSKNFGSASLWGTRREDDLDWQAERTPVCRKWGKVCPTRYNLVFLQGV